MLSPVSFFSAPAVEVSLGDWIRGKTVQEIYKVQIEYLLESFTDYDTKDAERIIQILDEDWKEHRSSFPREATKSDLGLIDIDIDMDIPPDFLREILCSKPVDPFAFDPSLNPERPRGLNNWSDDCFLNALFQVIILGDGDIQRVLCEKFSIIKNYLQAYFAQAPISMKALRSFLAEHAGPSGQNFLVGQHDPHEVVITLLKACGDECLSSSALANKKITKRVYKAPEGCSFFVEADCHATKHDTYSGEGILVPFLTNEEGGLLTRQDGKIYLEDLLSSVHHRQSINQSDEYVERAIVTPEGEVVSMNVPLEKEIFQFDHPPTSLLLPIVRFSEGRKISDPIEMSEHLFLPSDYFSCSGSEPTSYELEGFIVHVGHEPRCGHYVAYVSRRDEAGRKLYFSCDDGHVSDLTQEEFLEQAKLAYLLHFRKEDRALEESHINTI